MKILSPAGNMESLITAVYHGADEVYLGINDFNARNNIDGFTLDTLESAVDFAHIYNVKVFLAINILFTSDELEKAVSTVITAYNLGVDAFIIQDLGLINILSTDYPEIEIHASTQMGIHNYEGVKYLEQFGVKRVVLSRETPLNEIKRIRKNSNIEIEYFVQGALCVSFSGNCYLSSKLFNESGNRGRCKQPCRLPYKLKKDGKIIKDGYLLSAKDFNLSDRLNDLEQAGVDSLKIEGRARRPFYVATATREYKNAVLGKTVNQENLKLGFNRNYTEGYFNGNGEIISSIQSHIGVYFGTVSRVVNGKKFNEIYIESKSNLSPKSVLKFYNGEKEITTLTAYDVKPTKTGYAITTTQKLEQGLAVRLILDYQKEQETLKETLKKDIKVYLTVKAGDTIIANVEVDDEIITVTGEKLEKAQKQPLSKQDFIDNFNKHQTFNADVFFTDFDDVFILKSQLNAFRRTVYQTVEHTLASKHKKNIILKPLKKQKTVKEFTDYKFVNSLDFNILEKNVVYSPETYTLEDITAFTKKVKEQNKNAYLDLPNFATETDVKLLKEIVSKTGVGVIANNYYALDITDNLVIGAGLNVYNDITANVFNKPYILAENNDNQQYQFPYMTLKHCPIKSHVGGNCKHCKYIDGYEYVMESGKTLKLKRKKLSDCTFYLTD